MDNHILIPVVSNTLQVVIAGVMFFHFNRKLSTLESKIDVILSRFEFVDRSNIVRQNTQKQAVVDNQETVDNTCNVASNISNVFDTMCGKVFQPSSSISSRRSTIESSIIPGNISSSGKVSADISKELSTLDEVDETENEE